MIGKGAGKLSRKIFADKAKKLKGKEAADVTVPSDTVRREGVSGERAAKAHTPSSQREAAISGTSAKQRAGWKSKKKILDSLENRITTNESRITALRKKSKESEEGKIKIKLAGQINKLKNRIKTLKERMELEVAGMKGMRKRQGPGVQVAKTGGTVKRSQGGLLGMGAALRGGGAVRKRGY